MIWVMEDSYKYHLREGGYDPYHVYPEGDGPCAGRTLPQCQPDTHFSVPDWCWLIYRLCDWLLGCAEMLCRRCRRKV